MSITYVGSADAKLSDARTPLAHTHAPGDVTGTAVVTADARLSDARTPTTHAASHMSGGSDAIGGLPVYNDTVTLNQTIATGQKCVVFGPITISSGTLTISGTGQFVILSAISGI